MFANALKSFTSNISSNYTISTNPSSTSGPWKIFDAKKKSTGKAASVFVFDKKSLEPQSGGLGGRTNAVSLKRAHEEVLERLKKEASSLARLRHPSILELVEPVEETRSGGLMFATEPVTASLAGLLQEKDEQERAGGVGGRSSRYVIEEADGKGRRRREVEIDELEIQKGLLQIGKGLEFLHESAALVHGNLTPDAIFINAKSDWKISGLGFSGPPDHGSTQPSAALISLSEVLNYDPRLPRSVQLNLDYVSPDFVLDTNVTTAADMFSLGLLIIALYNSPHRSPLETNSSTSTYKRLFASSSSVPTQNNNFLSSRPLPKEILTGLLPRLITRRPAQRLSAREFQQAQYFDNILVSTIRFLDSLPAKTPNEKSQFMRGLPRILNQFPKSVLEKKVLPALLEELKDRDLLSLVLQNVFKVITVLPSGKRAFSEKVAPRLREIFLAGNAAKGTPAERDSSKEAGVMIVLENMSVVVANTSGKEFRDDILPILHLALESPTHSLVDASLRTLPAALSVLDFSTIKNELFPVIAAVFSKTSSMGIKIRGLEALRTLCGGTSAQDDASGDGLDGVSSSVTAKTQQATSAVLDKYTIQEKVVPLLKAIKTKEPAVMMAALDVFKQVGKIADSDFLAMDVLPALWSFSLGPLLNLQQFQAFMTLIKSLSTRIEQEHTKKLQELSASNAAATTHTTDIMSFGAVGGSDRLGHTTNGDEGDFESLVTGRKPATTSATSPLDDDWGTTTAPVTQQTAIRTRSQQSSTTAPAFSWSTPAPASPAPNVNRLAPLAPTSRTITPDQNLSAFSTLTPSLASSNAAQTSFSQPLQPSRPGMGVLTPTPSQSYNASTSSNTQSSIDWSRASSSTAGWTMPNPSIGQSSTSAPMSALAIPPPPTSPYAGIKIAPPPAQQQQQRQASFGGTPASGMQTQTPVGQKQGLDKYESLL